MAIEITKADHVCEDMAIKFFEHFFVIAGTVRGEPEYPQANREAFG